MNVVLYKGRKQVKVEQRPIPKITDQKDVLVQITSTTICGSDLHIYHSAIPKVKKNDVLGHECMGRVVKVGSLVETLKIGDRVVVSAIIADGTCDYCLNQQFSLCEYLDQSIFGLFGYSHMTGGKQWIKS